MTFDTEEDYDEVVVKDGSMEIQKVSGDDIPGTVRSKGRTLLLWFHSDNSRVGAGFNLNIDFVEAQPVSGMYVKSVKAKTKYSRSIKLMYFIPNILNNLVFKRLLTLITTRPLF